MPRVLVNSVNRIIGLKYYVLGGETDTNPPPQIDPNILLADQNQSLLLQNEAETEYLYLDS